ncbi:MAG TPA: glucosamine-6-phosphate deaminase [Nocardioidaceae bacterium]|nr:glucosamine-6-phosphate deaminase [Nocardioidaceae bacterium]
MEVVIVASGQDGGELAARLVLAMAADSPDVVLGLATGGSPLPLYQSLRRAVADGADLSAARGFALDEYVGLPPEHPASYHSVIRREVVEPLGLDPDRVQVPDGMADDIPAACAAYEDAIRSAGGVDVQILGIGTDGHIGFNEPSSSLASRTRIKTLTTQTRHDNARFFRSVDEVPRHCITQGLGTIMDAGRLVLLASGVGKAAAVAAAVEGPVSANCPASVIQLHQHATVIVDEPAASCLEHADYYRETYANKPTWQQF